MTPQEAIALKAHVRAQLADLGPHFAAFGARRLAQPEGMVAVGIAPGGAVPDHVRVAIRLGESAIPASVTAILNQHQAGSFDIVTGVQYRAENAKPLYPGLSCSHVLGTAGTLGAIVRRVSAIQENYALSCAHVLALCGDAQAKTGRIYHPAVTEAPPGSCEEIGPLYDYVFADHRVDAAIARVSDTRVPLFPAYIDEQIRILDPNSTSKGARLNVKHVCKRGKNDVTQARHGAVTAYDLDDVVVHYDGPTGPLVRRFNNMIEIEGNPAPFSQPGDSGSLIVEGDPPHRPFAMLVGRTDANMRSIAHYFSDVESELGIELSR